MFTICSIVQSFEKIVDALISQENFTNLTIIQTDIAFQGLRVRESIIIACTNSLSTHMQIQRTDFMGITFVESSSSKNYIIYFIFIFYFQIAHSLLKQLLRLIIYKSQTTLEFK